VKFDYRGWEDLPTGCVVQGGTCHLNKTGAWKTQKPVVDREKCNRCMLCWIYCPDCAIFFESDRLEFNYDYCKGCGICANECPLDAIKMEAEVEG